jgi:uncharacterized protein
MIKPSMTSKVKLVFIDTSGFKAWVDEKDEFHQMAEKIIKYILDSGFVLTTSNYILDETWTLLRAKCGLAKVKLLKKYLLSAQPLVKITRVNIKDESSAWDWFETKDWSGLSFTDCVSFAQMRRLGIQFVFGFDQHFSRAKFNLLTETAHTTH